MAEEYNDLSKGEVKMFSKKIEKKKKIINQKANLKDYNKLGNKNQETPKTFITETYLKDKFNTMEVSNNIKNVISDKINKTNENVYNDISQNNININPNSKSFNSILNNSNIFKRRLSRETIKKLKLLKQNEDQIKKTINKLETSKKILEDEINLNNNIVEDNIKKYKLKEIEEKKDELNLRLYDLNLQIEKITDLTKPSKKEIMDNFYNNFEKDKEIYKEKAKKFYKDSIESYNKLKEDKKITFEKREKMLIEKEKENLEKKEKLFAEKNEKERENILKRKKEIDEKLEKTKQYINEKNHKTEKDYLYYINKEKFENEELRLLELSNLNKKQVITLEELEEFNLKHKNQRKIIDEEGKEKKKYLKNMWSDRNQLLNSYVTNTSLILKKMEKKEKENEMEKLEKKKELEKIKINYSNSNIPKPKVNINLKRSREKRKDKIDKQSVLKTEDNNKKRIQLYYYDPKINNNKSEYNLNNNILNNDFSNLLISKNKKLKPIRLLHPKPEKPINYLEEFQKKKNSSSQTYKNKIIIDDNDKNIFQTIKSVQEQSDNIDNKVRLKKEEMKIKGGYIKNIKIGDEIGNMIIQSIKSKMNVIEKLQD